MHVLLQYQSKSYYIIGQEVYYSIGRFYYIIGQLLQYRAFLLHYRAVITVSGVYYIIGWYSAVCVSGRYFAMSLMYIVKRVPLSELACDIPSLRHSFLDATPSI